MCFKFKTIFLFLLLSFGISFSQQKEIDSLKQILSQNISDSSRIDALILSTFHFQTISVDSFHKYALKSYKLAEKRSYKRLPAYSNLGLSLIHRYKNDSARYFFNKAIALLDQKEDSLTRASVLGNLAYTYENEMNFEKAAEYIFKAIPYVKNYPAKASLLYYNLGVDYGMGNFSEKSLEYYLKAYETSKSVNEKRVLGYATVQLAGIYLEKSDYNQAKKYINEAEELCGQNNNAEICHILYLSEAEYFSKQKDLQKANFYFRKSLDLALKINKTWDVLNGYSLLAKNENQLGNFKKAALMYSKFDSIYKLKPTPNIGLNVFEEWAAFEFKTKNYKRAFELLLSHTKLKDSNLIKENREILVETEKKYETEKKEREIAEQQVTIAEQELSLAKKQRQVALWGGVGGILALLLGISFWVGKERQKRKEQEIANLKNQQEIVRLEALVSGEEKERVRLAQDLHDGINGDLSVIKFKVDSINRKKLTQTETKTVGSTLDMLDNAIDQVRRISHNLAPPSLQNFNLNEAIRQHLGKIQLAHQMDIDFQTFGQAPNFSTEQETALYRIVQELVNNIVKHAEATETLVQLNHTEDFTQLVIEDNGKGFDTKISQNGIGLQNIASRVAFLKGDLNIESSGEGSTFTITLSKASIT